MRSEPIDKIEAFKIFDAPLPPNRGTLDPISVFIRDAEPGRGSIMVECYGAAWSCFWGAMGNGATVRQFLRGVDAGYVANCMIRSRRGWISNRRKEELELEYLTQICAAVIEHIKSEAKG